MSKLLILLSLALVGCGPIQVEMSGDFLVTHQVELQGIEDLLTAICGDDPLCKQEVLTSLFDAVNVGDAT